jgi:hypothetical protein
LQAFAGKHYKPPRLGAAMVRRPGSVLQYLRHNGIVHTLPFSKLLWKMGAAAAYQAIDFVFVEFHVFCFVKQQKSAISTHVRGKISM